ncbi:type II secretion system F family protein [archaeon]|nr:type II secretion system F family protein [archaeon]
MKVEEIRRNLEQEKKVIKEILYLQGTIQSLEESERNFYQTTIESLRNQLRILNNSLLLLINSVSFAKPLTPPPSQDKFVKPLSETSKNVVSTNAPVKMKYVSPSTKQPVFVSIDKKEKESFAKELRLSETNLSQLKKVSDKKQKIVRKWGRLAKVSNKVYGKLGEKLTPLFQDLKGDLRSANILFLLHTYVAMALFVSTISFFVALVIFITLMVFFPQSAILWAGWFFLLPVAAFLSFYFGPSLQKGTVEKNVTAELPFATIYMGAIAGSNVEPIRIFKIVAATPEYPFFGMEIRKVINQVELYGVDLVNALKNVAKIATNRRFAELLGGMATNILSGGSLKSYLDKKAENYLVDYRLEMEKYAAIAGTFMDIYISVLITAPLILMMVFVVIQLTNMSAGGLSSTVLFIIVITLVAVANIIFLVVLHLKQPK